MSIYLIEPYNAYNRNPKKKHPSEIAEEEAIFYKLMLEARAQESNRNVNLSAPQHSAPPSQTPTVAGNVGGFGGEPVPGFFSPTVTLNFSADSQTGSAPFTVNFTNLSSDDARAYYDFTWTFGDGTSANSLDATHTYASTGSFKVELTASNIINGGTPTTTSKASFISSSLPSMSVDFTSSVRSGSAPLAVTFTNLSVNGVTFKWVFGDGTTSSVAAPAHTFDTGSFNVKLESTGSFGQAYSTTKTPYISASLPVVTADFSSDVQSGSVPLAVTFSNLSTNASTYFWKFGESTASTSSAANPSWLYTKTGSFTVTLQATGSYNASASQAKLWVSASL